MTHLQSLVARRVLKKIAMATMVAAALGAGPVMGAQVPSGLAFSGYAQDGNFTMLTPDGGPVAGYTIGGTNDVTFTWDGSLFNASSDYTGPGSLSNATLSSPTIFYGSKWFASDVQIFAPGTYSFDTATGGGVSEIGSINMTVGPGQYGVHLLLSWNGGNNIDIVNVWNVNSTFSGCGTVETDSSGQNCLWTGATNTAGNSASTVWMFASTDSDGDGTLGVPMAPGGPFAGFSANFNIKGCMGTVEECAPLAIPIPAAGWLLMSGVLALFGLSRPRRIG